VVVNDLTGTDVQQVEVDLAALPGGNAGDGLADAVVVQGRPVADTIDVARLEHDRDQLWAEAAVAEATGEALHLPDELRSQAEDAQTARRISHPWRERLETLLDGHSGIVLKEDIYAALGIECGRQNKTFAGEIANHMNQLGWTAHRLRHPDKGRVHVFRHAECNVWLDVILDIDPGPPKRLRGACIKSRGTASEGTHDPFGGRRAA
jgi:predicted P-loop ATPase